MDCCNKPEEKIEKLNISETDNEKMKGGKMDKKVILWIVIAVLAIAVLYIVFFKGSGTGQVVSSVGQAASGAASSASSGMVDGC